MAGWCFRRGRDKATARERGLQKKAALKTKLPSQKNQPIYFPSNASKLSTTVGSQSMN